MHPQKGGDWFGLKASDVPRGPDANVIAPDAAQSMQLVVDRTWRAVERSLGGSRSAALFGQPIEHTGCWPRGDRSVLFG